MKNLPSFLFIFFEHNRVSSIISPVEFDQAGLKADHLFLKSILSNMFIVKDATRARANPRNSRRVISFGDDPVAKLRGGLRKWRSVSKFTGNVVIRARSPYFTTRRDARSEGEKFLARNTRYLLRSSFWIV